MRRIDLYACGCSKQGFVCPDHRRPPRSDLASSPMALAALALFAGTIAVWAAILG